MKRNPFFLSLIALLSLGGIAGCTTSSKTLITVCASELPHAKILNEVIKGIAKEDGYDLQVTVLDWTLQNDAVANGEYDANYFEHVPYLKTYEGTTPLYAACKVHYEKLCVYASNKDKKIIENGSTIELVDDVSNVERALQLLAGANYLTINPDNYDVKGAFTNFDATHPNNGVTWKAGFENCRLTCIKESQLCQSLPDYNFAIIPGNTALTGLGEDYASRIVFGENPSEALLSAKANIITVKRENKDDAKTAELVKAFADERVASYIAKTFGESVIYHYENGLTTDFLAV
jgi:D-methionine transport system substrate-binding protein